MTNKVCFCESRSVLITRCTNGLNFEISDEKQMFFFIKARPILITMQLFKNNPVYILCQIIYKHSRTPFIKE